MRALTTGVGPLTTNSQYAAAKMSGRDISPTIVITVGLKTASDILLVIVSAKPIPERKKCLIRFHFLFDAPAPTAHSVMAENLLKGAGNQERTVRHYSTIL